MKVYLTTFLVVTTLAAIVYRSVSTYGIPWWPDAFVIGSPFGAVAALGAWQHNRTNRWLWSQMTGALRRRRARRRNMD